MSLFCIVYRSVVLHWPVIQMSHLIAFVSCDWQWHKQCARASVLLEIRKVNNKLTSVSHFAIIVSKCLFRCAEPTALKSVMNCHRLHFRLNKYHEHLYICSACIVANKPVAFSFRCGVCLLNLLLYHFEPSSLHFDWLISIVYICHILVEKVISFLFRKKMCVVRG